MPSNKKIILALGGGGAKGLAHIGVLRVLEEAGIVVSAIAGSSIGALVGALYALDYTPDEMEAVAKRYNNRRALLGMIDLDKPEAGLLKGRKIAAFISALTAGRTFADCRLPLRVLATSLNTGEQAVIKSGPLDLAILASIAVPGIFKPVKAGQEYLVDGGLLNPTPIDVARRLGNAPVVGVDLTMRKSGPLSKPGMFTTLMISYDIMRTQAVRAKFALMDKNTVIIKPKPSGVADGFKFNHTSEFIKAGEDAAKKKLPEILKKLG